MKTVINLLDRLLRKITPDPFVIAIILTMVTVGLAWAYTDHGPAEIIEIWGSGFWNLATFTLQMAMILLGGYVVATSPPVKKSLEWLVGFVNTPVQAVVFCTLAAALGSWINWGFGLVIGGVVALEVSKRVPKAPFRLLVASSYSGFLVWHAGLSGSIPLSVNTEGAGNLAFQNLERLVPLSETIFSTLNLIALGSMLVLLPLLNVYQLSVIGDEPEAEFQEQPESHKPKQHVPFAERIILFSGLLALLGGAYLLLKISSGTFKLDLNSINFIFFMLGLALHGSPRAFMDSVTEAITKVAPILIQYPLYAAIMMVLKETGMAAMMAEWFVNNSSQRTFPLMTFYSAGLINFFVPSGGGQWAVQAPIVLPAAETLGADIPKTIMAVSWGDAWTNMAQPFWAVPVLTIAGLEIKDIIGLCLTTLIASGIVLSLIFLLI